MSYNYNLISESSGFGNQVQKNKDSKAGIAQELKSSLSFGTILVLFLSLFGVLGANAQTTLISPSQEITFGNGATDWKVANDGINKWYVGALQGISGTCAYVSQDGGATNTYKTVTATAQNSYFYRDIAVPAGETKIALSFKWKNGGEAGQDFPLVYAATTNVTPFGGSNLSGDFTEITGSSLHSNPGTYKDNTFYLPAKFAGNTVRIIFLWKNDINGGGVQPPASIDNVSLISSLPETITSLKSGNWNDPTTWIDGQIPYSFDNVIIDSNHVVNIDISLTAQNITIKNNAELNFTATGSSIGIGCPCVENKILTLNGNLNIDNGGVFKIFDTNSIRQTFNIAGNLTNNGSIMVPTGFGSTDNTLITFNGSTPQTISGTGSFGSYLQSVTFANTSTATPNIIWNTNNVVIGRTLTLTNARVSLNGNKIFLGNTTSATANLTAGLTITAGSNSGFLPGGTISRRITTGSTIPVGDPTATQGQFPIITSNGFNRSLFINRSAGTSTQLAVNYTDDNTIATVTGVTETGYTINKRLNSNWTVTVDGVSATTNTYRVALMGANGLFPVNGNSRVLYANAAIAGTHEPGTTTPSVRRAGLTEAMLTQAPLYIGLADADNSISTVASGDWNTGSTWSTGTVPVSSAIVAIQPGHTVTVAGNVNATNVTVALGGALTLNSGDFNLGDTGNKTRIMNINGTMTVNSGATLNVYGSLKTNLGSTFIQNGGSINVDINSGSAGTSLATGQRGLLFTSASTDNLKLIAGSINLLNPHFLGGNDLVMEVIQYGSVINQSGTNHTLRFKDDDSDLENVRTGTHNNGIQYSATASGATPFVFSDVWVETTMAIGTAAAVPNRAAKSTTAAYIGKLSLTLPGSEFSTGTLYLSGDLTNTEGVLRTTSTFGFATAALNSTGSVIQAPVTTPQTVVNENGFFYKQASGTITSNEHFAALTINNTSTSGVTFNFAPSMSGTLTLTNGKLNLPAGGSLLMTAAAPNVTIQNTNSYSYINGGFQRSIPASVATSGANTFLLFPVGTADAYKPMWIASANTAAIPSVSVRAVSNTGDAAGTLENMATTSWITAITGTTSEMYFRIGDSAINSGNILASSATVNGPYTTTFGNSAFYTPGNPNQLQTVNPVSGTNYSAAITYANLASCTGTPNPGATLVNNVNSVSKTINLGDELTFSLENNTTGGQVTYTWQKSVNNTDYTNINGANTATYTLQPTEAVYYRCMVSCAGVTATSTPVQITFPNSIVSTSDAERCGDGSLTLEATGSTGTTVRWYATPQGGLPLATANSFTTPELTASTDYYAAAETTSTATFTVGPKTYIDLLSNSASSANTKHMISTVNAVTLTSIDYYPSFAGPNTFKLINGSTTLTQAITITQEQVDAANLNKTANPVPVTVVLNFPIVPVNGVTPSLECDRSVYYGYAKSAYNFPIINNGFQLTEVANQTNRMLFFNWKITSDQAVVSSARSVVKATINQTTQIGLSAPSANICGTGNATVTLTTPADNYDTYTWTPNTGVTGDATNGWVFSPATTTTYTLKGEKGSCSDTETFTVNAGPVAADQTICGYILGEPISGLPAQFGDATVYNLTPKPDTSIKWYAEADATTPLANNTKLINDHTYYVSQNFSCGESPRTAVKVTLNSPAAPTAESSQFFCTTGTVTELTATGVGITWENSSAVILNPSSAILHNNHYFARQTIDGCPSPVALNVVALDKQQAPLADATQNFCGTEQVRTLADLVVVSPSTAVIKWYSSAVSTTVLPMTTTLVNNTTYYASQDNSATACAEINTNRVAVKATINPIPEAPTGAAEQTVENGATIAALSVTGQNVVWYETEANALADINPLISTTVLNNATYFAMQTVNGCRSAVPLAVNVTVTVLGVNDFDLAGLKFYPNPVVDFVTISNTTSVSAIKVFNMLGQRVISVTPNSLETKIDMSSLPRGTYLIQIDSEGKSAKIKLVKN